jgi:predicted ArsR family transcriptional regulator
MSKISDRHKGILNRSFLRDYFAVNPDWISAVALSKTTGLHIHTIHVHCRNLITCGYLEEKLIRVTFVNARNGRDVIHYRRKISDTQNVTPKGLALASVKSCHGC